MGPIIHIVCEISHFPGSYTLKSCHFILMELWGSTLAVVLRYMGSSSSWHLMQQEDLMTLLVSTCHVYRQECIEPTKELCDKYRWEIQRWQPDATYFPVSKGSYVHMQTCIGRVLKHCW